METILDETEFYFDKICDWYNYLYFQKDVEQNSQTFPSYDKSFSELLIF